MYLETGLQQRHSHGEVAEMGGVCWERRNSLVLIVPHTLNQASGVKLWKSNKMLEV